MANRVSSRPVIPWWSPSLGAREKALVCEVIEANFPNEGEHTAAFEERIAELCGVPYAVAVTSGTTALFLGLLACGVGPDDEVIVPDVTFVATANAVTLAGAKTVLVDVRLDSFTIDPAAVEAAITGRTKAIIPVHVSGRGADMPSLLALAERYRLRIVEDAAEALGSALEGRPLGGWGDVGCFSFSPNKTVTTGQGGMAVTRDPALSQRLQELKDQGRPAGGARGADEHVSLGYNFKLTNLQAAVGLAQLERFPARQDHLRRIFRLYRERLAGVSRLRLPGFNLEGGECPQWVDAMVEGRDSLHEYLLARNVYTRKFWAPVHTQPYYWTTDARFPASLQVSAKGLWLPSALSLTEDDVRQVCDFITQWSREVDQHAL